MRLPPCQDGDNPRQMPPVCLLHFVCVQISSSLGGILSIAFVICQSPHRKRRPKDTLQRLARSKFPVSVQINFRESTMADAAATETASGKLVIRDIGLMLSGKIEDPIYDADCLIAVDGKITEWGREKDLDTEGADTLIDAHGTTLAPGLIDSHIHPVAGDYTPRQQQLHWIDSTLHGGVTTMISAGEVHMPGRPKDIVGLKAMAIASQRWYE